MNLIKFSCDMTQGAKMLRCPSQTLQTRWHLRCWTWVGALMCGAFCAREGFDWRLKRGLTERCALRVDVVWE